jgi:hypothetical protein
MLAGVSPGRCRVVSELWKFFDKMEGGPTEEAGVGFSEPDVEHVEEVWIGIARDDEVNWATIFLHPTLVIALQLADEPIIITD